MAQQIIDIGTAANDGTGEPLRDAFDKVNNNDTELYAAVALKQPLDSDLTAIAALTTTSIGRDLLTATDAAAIRAKSGLVIGTDVQAYNAGIPYLLDSSAVAVPLTGSTSLTALATINIPAGAMGPNGFVRVTVLFTNTNNANSKTASVKFGATSYFARSFTTIPTNQFQVIIQNRNSVSSQVGHNSSGYGYDTTSGAPITSTENSASIVALTINGQLANAADTMTLERYIVEIFYKA